VTPEWTMTPHGTMVVPDGVGLGVGVDRDRIEYLTVRETTLS